MSLTSLIINNLRNLAHVKVQLSSRFNLLSGANGSGKTSFLEAIHYLGLGRSFRTRLHSRIINQEADHFSLFAQIQQAHTLLSVGVDRHANGDGHIRINQENVRSAVELTRLLPLQLLNTECRLLLTGSSKLRRQFIDWGLFHVEPEFFPCWQQAERILKQRNAALRSQSSPAILHIWNVELDRVASMLSLMRQQYVQQLKPIFFKILEEFLPNKSITLVYKAGWDEKAGLIQVLEQSWSRDLQLGYSQYGPQRADILIRAHKSMPAHEVLSHGQQKLLVYALRLAQGVLLQQQADKRCIYLLDDLPAELDAQSCKRVAFALNEIAAQVFVTGVNKSALAELENFSEARAFHVEHGICSAR